MPILGVGAQDSFPDIGEVLRPAGPNVTGVVIPNADHFVLSDNPTALTRALRTFFDSDEGGAGSAASR
jgi:pimeloyl-ACP methyl ester carboxylesterase